MKKIIILGTVALAAVVLLGAGCAPKQMAEKPAGEQAPAAVDKSDTNTSDKSDLNVSKDDLDKLKNDIQALDTQDLNAPKN